MFVLRYGSVAVFPLCSVCGSRVNVPPAPPPASTHTAQLPGALHWVVVAGFPFARADNARLYVVANQLFSIFGFLPCNYHRCVCISAWNDVAWGLGDI